MSTVTQKKVSLESALNTLCAELIDAFMDAEPGAYTQADAEQLLKSYIRHVARCGLVAGRTGYSELQDYCVQFQDILKNLLNQPPGVIAEYQGVLEQWPLLLMSYINSAQPQAFAEQIAALITQTAWPDSGESAAQQQTHEDTTVDEPGDSTTDMQSPSSAVAQDLCAELHAIYTDLDRGLEQTHDPEYLRYSLMQAGSQFELFAISAASAGLLGLMDVANLVAASLHNLAEKPHGISAQAREMLTAVRTSITAYLNIGRGVESVNGLISSVRQLPGAQDIPEHELTVLRDLLAGAVTEKTDTLDRHADTVSEACVSGSVEVVSPAEAEDVADDAPAPVITQAARELLQLVAAEFEQAVGELAMSLHEHGKAQANDEAMQHAAQAYAAILERFESVFESIALEGMKKLFAALRAFFIEHATHAQLSTEQQMWLTEWPAHVMNYLADPLAGAQDLVQHCEHEQACLQLDAQTRRELVLALQMPVINIEEDEAEPRQTVASEDDVSLALPDDVNQQLLESLLQELPNQTAEFSRVISNLISGHGSLKDVDTAQRVAHTLKGSANTVGVAGIANLTHHLEDILLAFTRQKQLPVAPLTNTLQDAADVLEMMSENLLGQGQLSTKQAQGVLQQVLDWANQIDLNGLPQASDTVAVPAVQPEDVQQEKEPSTVQNTETMLRVSTQSVDESLRLIGESIILNAQLGEGLRRIMGQNTAIRSQSEMFQQLAFELEQLIDVRGMHSLLAGGSNASFDALEMDQYNELHTLTRRLVEAATDSRELTQVVEDDLKSVEVLVHQQRRVAKDTQEVVMKTRMLPVQNIIPRLQRSVRQACRITGKEVELIIRGNDTLIDNDILNSLADPLMHILRNAVDHGIEATQLREARQKPATGQIQLTFSREGEHIMIRCQDDGAGLDYAAIREQAVEKGLLKPDAEPTNEELSRLIFVAGLTTRHETTQMSGRGIGMDAVYTQIIRMKGSINVTSEAQHGTLIEIQLPISLISMHGILVLARSDVMALSNRNIEQILHADAGQVRQENNALYYHYADAAYQAFYLEDLLGMTRLEQDPALLNRPALMLEGKDGKKVVVLVEKILNTQDIVIKKLGKYVPPIPGVEGATILGDGRVAGVIDLPSLLNAFRGSDYTPMIERSDLSGIQSGTPKVLVVDDSLSARRSLAEFMQDSGYRVITARDGIEAIEQIDENAPDILLVDMEMPRMNGLELTSYIRANQATRNLPVIMITSRATDRHRVEADRAGVNDYLVKPYSEDEVLDKLEAQLSKAFAYHESIAG